MPKIVASVPHFCSMTHGFCHLPGLDEAEIATSAPLLIGDWVRVVVRLIVSSGVIKHAGPLGNE